MKRGDVTTRVVRAVFLAAVFGAIVHAHGFTEFDGIRIKIVRGVEHPAEGVARSRVPRPSRINDLVPPFAVIAEISNDLPDAADFTLRVDDTAVCTRRVPGTSIQRVDCAMTGGWHPTESHEVAVTGLGDNWRLTYFELATHHGGSAGLTDLRVVPIGFSRYGRIGWLATGLAFVVFSGLLLVSGTVRLPTPVLVLHRIATGLIFAVLVIVAVLPFVSSYNVVVSVQTFAIWGLVAFAPRLWVLGRTIAAVAAAQWRRGATVLACWLVAMTVLAVYRAVVVHRLRIEYHNDQSGLLVISKDTFDHNPLLKDREDVRQALILRDGGGYDGQFMYFATFDPFLRAFHTEPARYNQMMDAPPYRFGRIGFSLLTRIIARNHWQLYPVTMSTLVLGSLAACALALALVARKIGASPWWGLLALLVPGFYQSIQVDLPEPLAAAVLLGGYWCWLTQRRWPATLLFAFAPLVRETSVVLVLCVAAEDWLHGKRGVALRMAGVAVVPVLAWHAYVGSILYPDWGLRAFWLVPNTNGPPFGGFIRLWSEIAAGRYFNGAIEMARAGIWFPLVLTSGLLLAGWLAIRKPSAVTVASVIYGVLAVSLNFESVLGHVGNAQRVSYELFITLALGAVQVAGYPRSLRIAVYAFWAFAGAYVFFGAFDASFVRESLLSARLW